MPKLVGSVREAIMETFTSDEMSKWVHKVISEEVMRVIEATDLVSLVVKTESEELANSTAEFLKAQGIDARSKYPSKFDPFSKTEVDSWGVYVRPSDVKPAAEKLVPRSKGLEFDPYVNT